MNNPVSFQRPVCDALVKAKVAERRMQDQFVIFDSASALAEYANAKVKDGARNGSWAGDTFANSVSHTMNGDLSRVAASDAMLAKFENVTMPTARHETVDNVVGAFPNVPAFLSGNPYNMRLRKRSQSEAAPLAVIVDVVCSSGISAADMLKRGAAILALVRALANKRPIELWAVAGMHSSCGALWLCARLDTAPLDLAHVAPVLCGADYARNLTYGIGRVEHGFNGAWPYSCAATHRDYMRDILAPAFPHVAETLCVPAPYLADKLLKDPEAWIKDKLAEYGAVTEEGA